MGFCSRFGCFGDLFVVRQRVLVLAFCVNRGGLDQDVDCRRDNLDI